MSRFIRSNAKKFFIFMMIFFLFFSSLNFSTSADETLIADLIPYDLIVPSSWEEGTEVDIIFKIQNVGTENVSQGETINVGLFLDDQLSPIATNSTTHGLDIGNTTFVNLSWTATLSDGEEHTLNLLVNYNQILLESNYLNNIWTFQVEFPEKSTDLEITNIQKPDSFIVNQTANILATVRNNGQDTDEDIYLRINSSESEDIETLVKEDGLDRDDSYIFSFDWTPSYFGLQSLAFTVIADGQSYDTEEISVNVAVGELEWWDANWHYRYFLTVNGSGDASYLFNFTNLLDQIDVTSESFENDTIRVVKYSNDGLVEGVVSDYNFNEANGFNKINNATGNLVWDVTEDCAEKYYCIYFDVESNMGSRGAIAESQTIAESGNASVTEGFVDAWKLSISQPVDGGYTLLTDPIDFSIKTDAKAKAATAFVFLTGNESHNFTLNLVDAANQVSWVYDDFYFDSEGNWTIRVDSVDSAGYSSPMVSQNFLVGKPDIKITKLSLYTDWDSYSAIYKNSTVYIEVQSVSDVTVSDVNISLSIIDTDDDLQKYYYVAPISFVKDEVTNITFEWFADISAKFELYFLVDSSDEVNESDEENNEDDLSVTIYAWPDLLVKDILFPSVKIMEYDDVQIDIVVENKGAGKAYDYYVNLYIEKADDDLRIMKYKDPIDSQKITVSADSSETVTLNWDSASSGTWLVGIKILVGDWQKDSNIINNYKLADEDLIVKSYEKNKPIISNIDVSPFGQQQGGRVTITANVTDDTGLEYVRLIFLTPSADFFEVDMIRTVNDTFKYVFDETTEIGTYTYSLEALDLSVNKNKKSISGSFTILEDYEDPVISYYSVKPYVQLKGESVTISCIATDNTDLDEVTVTIIYPNEYQTIEIMDLSSNGKYEYTDIYDLTGKYIYEILVSDDAGNWVRSDQDIFWITTDLNDTDNDGMPNDWERRYGFDSEDPTDAKEDLDEDGFTNAKEYELGSHPEKDIAFQNIANRLKENVWYLTGSIIAFLAIFLFAIYGKRRKRL